MENENLINAYIANLAKSVNDLTLENLLLKSKQQNAATETNEVREQVSRQAEEIQELKDTEEKLRNEIFDLQRKAKDDADFIERLEGGIEQANEIIAQFEQEKDGALAKVAKLEKEAKQASVAPSDTSKLKEEKDTLFNQNVKLLKDLDYAEKKIKELKDKLRNQNKEESVNGDNNQAETVRDGGLGTEFR